MWASGAWPRGCSERRDAVRPFAQPGGYGGVYTGAGRGETPTQRLSASSLFRGAQSTHHVDVLCVLCGVVCRARIVRIVEIEEIRWTVDRRGTTESRAGGHGRDKSVRTAVDCTL